MAKKKKVMMTKPIEQVEVKKHKSELRNNHERRIAILNSVHSQLKEK